MAEPRLMAGILVSSKTAKGRLDKLPGRYPESWELNDLFREGLAYNTLTLCHYNTDNQKGLVRECEEVMNIAGPGLCGFQFNVCWPNPVLLQEIRKRYPKLYILLQISGRAMNEFRKDQQGVFSHYDTERFTERMKPYSECVNEVLLDPSGGIGQLLQAERLMILTEVLMKFEGLGIGVVGGLSSETMNKIRPLAKMCPYLSIDAEAKLRNIEDDSLNLRKAQNYLKAAFALFYLKGQPQCTRS